MNQSRVRTIVSWVLAALIGVAFCLGGAFKLSGGATEMFAGWGYPAWFATLTGVLELAGGIGLLIPRTTRYAVYGLTGIMIGAAYTHLSNAEGLEVLRPLIFAAVLWLIWILRGPYRVQHD